MIILEILLCTRNLMVSCEYLNHYHLTALPEYADTVDYFNPSHVSANSHALTVWILVLVSLSLLIGNYFYCTMRIQVH